MATWTCSIDQGYKWGYLGGAVDDLDRRILGALRANGRIPFTQIAQRAGVSETTIRTRYHNLVASETVRTVGIIEPSALGYEATAMVTVTAEPGMADQIARTIARVPEVCHVVTTLGSFDLILQVYCRDLSHLADVVTQGIQQIPGVRATETLVIADSYKLACDWSPDLTSESEA
jgi:Lrp/AsnC family transcriptional regulator for asnA, asnC and gidA